MKKMKSSRSRLYLWGGLLLTLMLGVMLAEYLIPWDAYAQDLSMAQQPPSAGHLLGTDRYGRDMLARVLVGGRTSIWGALVVVLLITTIGTGIGTGSGWYGGRIEQAWMGLSDVFLAFPGLVLALAVAGVSGGGMLQAVLALAAIGWPKYARLSRRLTVSLKGEPYIDIARMPRDLFLEDHVRSYTSEYGRPDFDDGGTGYRDDDDGAGGTFLFRTRREAADTGMGRYDE